MNFVFDTWEKKNTTYAHTIQYFKPVPKALHLLYASWLTAKVTAHGYLRDRYNQLSCLEAVCH